MAAWSSGSGRAAARLRCRPIAGRCRAGSMRTPTRPRSGRSARPRSGRGARRCTRSLRSVWVELLGEKHRCRLEDLVARRSSEFSWRNALISSRSWLVSRSGRSPRQPRPGARRLRTFRNASRDRAATCAIGRRSRAPAGHRDQLLGYFFGRRHLTTEDLLSTQDRHPGCRGHRQSRSGSLHVWERHVLGSPFRVRPRPGRRCARHRHRRGPTGEHRRHASGGRDREPDADPGVFAMRGRRGTFQSPVSNARRADLLRGQLPLRLSDHRPAPRCGVTGRCRSGCRPPSG